MAKKTYLVKKEDTASMSNVLNEMFYEEKMTLQELRFFLVYLSKINPKKPDETEVTFTLEDYANILGVELNEKAIDVATRKLLRHVVCVRAESLSDEYSEGHFYCQLFSRAKLLRRKKDNKWYLTFECHEDIKDKIFNLQREYTRLEIWNAVALSNFQDIRMYMLLRQYKRIGERTIDLVELKKMLGIDADAYPEYKIFSRDVLKKCQRALREHTDICFEFNAVGRPAKSVHFSIFSNSEYELPAFLSEDEDDTLDGQASLFSDGDVADVIPIDDDGFLLSADALPGFTRGQIEALREMALRHMPYEDIHTLADKEMWLHHFFTDKYRLMKAQVPEVQKPWAWMKKAVQENFH